MTGTTVFEAEHMYRAGGFAVVHGTEASGGKLAKLACGSVGSLYDTYYGPAGTFDLTVHAQDEMDGCSTIDVYVDGRKVGSVRLDQPSNEVGSDHGGFDAFTLTNLDIPSGACIELRAMRDGGEYVRIDKITMEPSADPDDAPGSCGAGTVTLIDENFDHGGIHDIDAIKRDGNWKVNCDALFTNGCNDGVLKFAPVELSGQTEAALSFRIKTPCIDPFETSDYLKIVLVVDGEPTVLDVFRRDGHEFKGSVSGMTFGEHYTDLSYAMIDLPEGAQSVTLKFISSISARNEIIKIDDVKLTATGDACDDCPEGFTKISFDDLPRGTVVSDQYEGVTITAIANGFNKNNVFVIEAEDFDHLDGVHVEHNWAASGNAHVKAGSHGSISTTFTGDSDTYKIAIDVQDECDGKGIVEVLVNGSVVGTFEVRGKEGESGWTSGRDWGGKFSTFTLPNAIDIASGDTVKIVYRDPNGGELGRIDKVSFIDQTPDNAAMIFDTDNISGGDHDLAVGDGNVLIISEDGDSSDPDDNAKGGSVCFDFDNPVDVASIVVIDTEEGGKINAYDADGNLIGTVDVPHLQDNTKATVDLDFEGVAKLEVVLNGSGAVDDLCYDKDGPNGGNDPMNASIAGRYFCDDNFSNTDTAGDPAVVGALVELLDAAGNVIATQRTGDDGEYLFEGLAAGDYSVRFAADPDGDGKIFVTQNAGIDDTIDSDVDTVTGTTGTITLAAGEASTDNDAGIVDPRTAQLGDTLFVDANRDGRQNDAANAVAAGVTVSLLDASLNVIDTTVTGIDGTYLFDGLAKGTYYVDFDDVAGFDFTTAFVGDTAGDSNVDAAGLSDEITLAIGESNLTIDAGLVRENTAPDAVDDNGKVCANELLAIDVLANDSDPENDPLAVTQLAGQSIADGETISIDGTATVNGSSFAFTGLQATLTGGVVTFDGESAFEGLDIGEEATVTLSYTIDDGEAGSASADIDLTFCGVAETIEELAASLPAGLIGYSIINNYASGNSAESYDIVFSGTGDARFDGLTVTDAYCASALEATEVFPTVLSGELKPLTAAVAGELFGTGQNGEAAGDNLDLISWIINQDFEGQTSGAGGTFTQADIQSAIWGLTDNFLFNTGGNNARALEIYDAAINAPDSEGFVSGPGGKAVFYLDPVGDVPDREQPFIFAVEFDDYDCLC
ncbi:hypothetical protein DKT77_11495 [Meridianimarinicoccus roseus]|uniref:SD-repeat containing protein B domain-containing protein n=1 Tax=Meridianimarinicoccus roseus TaxID=2072018 RepID=A0A2V2LL83_9RHOB|nr:SdrD B-like domain-containing protein [Meridianimarinicoccus roseus]PWR02543.1 hypothetical protein DKT77_11495 [Meridianimarinicoccus roseus]